MKRLLLMLFLCGAMTSSAQITNRLIVTQNFEQGINAPNLMFTVPPNDNRIYVASRDSLKLNINQIRKWRDSTFTFNSTLFKAIGYIPDWSEITGKPSFFNGDYNSLTNRPNLALYYLASNPSGYISSVPAQTWASITGKPAFAPVSTSGSYNDLINQPTIPNYTAGTGISVISSTISNTAPDQTVVLSGSNGITTSGTYPNFTVAKTKRQETYSGSTNASGNYTVTFGTAYSSAPNIQANIIGGTNTNLIKISSVSTTGFTVNVVTRVDVIGLLPTYNNVNGASVDVLTTEK